MNQHVCKPAYARWTLQYLPGRGYRLIDPKGVPQSAVYAGKDKALTAMECAQARTDAAMKKGIRACLCCQRPFESEGIHNRMCGPCRGREAESYSPYGLAPRSGRAR